MPIDPLPQEVRSYLRTGVAITSVIQCVEELVLNSLDAGATCVAVRVDLNCFKVQVVDNGSGISQDQLELLGNRFWTSKCHALSDLDNLCHYGYRGEALASIRDACGVLDITTRSKISSRTYCKLFQEGKSLKVSESSLARPSPGTTVTVHELFMNFPVRQKSLNKTYELEKIRETLESIALIKPGISLTLRNDSTGHVIFQTRKCTDIVSVFAQLFGTSMAEMLCAVHGELNSYKLTGYLGRDGHSRKNLQFVYINGRLVKKSWVHKSLNRILTNLPCLKVKLKQAVESPGMTKQGQYIFKSPPKFSEAYPVYVVQIKCPISEYDITFDPAKTMVEFKDWESLLNCVEAVAKQFVREQNTLLVGNTDESLTIDEEKEKAYDNVTKTVDENTNTIAVENLTDVLRSKTARRVTSLPVTSLLQPSNKTSREDTEMFKTPQNDCRHLYQDVLGVGNRQLDETDIEESSSLAEHETMFSTSDDTSSADSSACSDTTRPHSHTNQAPPMLGSLSRYKQSIGKFTNKRSSTVSVDESLKKLNTLLPRTTSATSKHLFSSLQRFRRKVETTSSMEVNDEEDDHDPNSFRSHSNVQPGDDNVGSDQNRFRLDENVYPQVAQQDNIGEHVGGDQHRINLLRTSNNVCFRNFATNAVTDDSTAANTCACCNKKKWVNRETIEADVQKFPIRDVAYPYGDKRQLNDEYEAGQISESNFDNKKFVFNPKYSARLDTHVDDSAMEVDNAVDQGVAPECTRSIVPRPDFPAYRLPTCAGDNVAERQVASTTAPCENLPEYIAYRIPKYTDSIVPNTDKAYEDSDKDTRVSNVSDNNNHHFISSETMSDGERLTGVETAWCTTDAKYTHSGFDIEHTGYSVELDVGLRQPNRKRALSGYEISEESKLKSLKYSVPVVRSGTGVCNKNTYLDDVRAEVAIGTRKLDGGTKIAVETNLNCDQTNICDKMNICDKDNTCNIAPQNNENVGENVVYRKATNVSDTESYYTGTISEMRPVDEKVDNRQCAIDGEKPENITATGAASAVGFHIPEGQTCVLDYSTQPFTTQPFTPQLNQISQFDEKVESKSNDNVEVIDNVERDGRIKITPEGTPESLGFSPHLDLIEGKDATPGVLSGGIAAGKEIIGSRNAADLDGNSIQHASIIPSVLNVPGCNTDTDNGDYNELESSSVLKPTGEYSGLVNSKGIKKHGVLKPLEGEISNYADSMEIEPEATNANSKLVSKNVLVQSCPSQPLSQDSVTLTQLLQSTSVSHKPEYTIHDNNEMNSILNDDASPVSSLPSKKITFTFNDLFSQTPIADRSIYASPCTDAISEIVASDPSATVAKHTFKTVTNLTSEKKPSGSVETVINDTVASSNTSVFSAAEWEHNVESLDDPLASDHSCPSKENMWNVNIAAHSGSSEDEENIKVLAINTEEIETDIIMNEAMEESGTQVIGETENYELDNNVDIDSDQVVATNYERQVNTCLTKLNAQGTSRTKSLGQNTDGTRLNDQGLDGISDPGGRGVEGQDEIDRLDESISSKWHPESEATANLLKLLGETTKGMSLVPEFIAGKPGDVQKNLNTVKFNKDNLQDVQVIGQLDKKFIACVFNTNRQQVDGDECMLVLVDQHAAHERIRLEVLTEDAFVDGRNGGPLKAFIVDPPRLLEFPEYEIRSIEQFKTEFTKIGISFERQSANTILVSSVPTCLLANKNDVTNIYWATIQVLIREHLSVFMSTRGAQPSIPLTIHKVLCSQACHGAIKFGDKLSMDECSCLLHDLSHCDLPFQCAHGRPSVMPLLPLHKLQPLTQDRKKPQLWKLKKVLEKRP